MSFLVKLHNGVFALIEKLLGDWFLPTLARVVFAGVLFMYFWNSAMTKLDGLVPGLGAYAQIVPKAMEAAGFDPSGLSQFDHAIVWAGTYGEVILPVLVLIGLFTRIASLGMIVFVIVMSYTDIVAHSVDAETIGAWFDNASGSLIVDQRSLWMVLFAILVAKGPGPFSVDRLLGTFARPK